MAALSPGLVTTGKFRRLGPQIPESSLVAYRDVQMAVANCCGIPPALMDSRFHGNRDSARAGAGFYMGAVEPVASLIAEVASEALEVEVSFDFSGTWAHDLTGRAEPRFRNWYRVEWRSRRPSKWPG